MLSQSLWALFFSWYGGGPALKWKINMEQSDVALRQTQLKSMASSIEARMTEFLSQPIPEEVKQPAKSPKRASLNQKGKGVYDAIDLIQL